MFLKVDPSMNLMTLIAHSPSPLGSSTNGQLYQRLPYQEVKENGLIRMVHSPETLVSLINN
jgi:hypothetical protein